VSVRDRLHALLDRPALHDLAARAPRLRRIARRLSHEADGTPAIRTGLVDWEGLTFELRAPLHTHRVARTRGIENTICRVVRLGVPEGGTVVDVGANYGFVAMVAAKVVGPGGRVLAVECDPDVLSVLRSTVAANGAEHVDVVEAFATAPGRGRTVDELCAGLPPVDLLKVDTDGDDLAVLLGAEAVVARDRPIVVIELTQDEEDIVDWLRQRYDLVLDQRGQPVAAPPWPENVIAAVSPAPWSDRYWRPRHQVRS